MRECANVLQSTTILNQGLRSMKTCRDQTMGSELSVGAHIDLFTSMVKNLGPYRGQDLSDRLVTTIVKDLMTPECDTMPEKKKREALAQQLLNNQMIVRKQIMHN